MLRVMTFNANGIRSAGKKGFWTWFEKQDAELLNRADEIVTTSGLVVRRDANGEWIVDMENRYDSYIYVRIGDLWSAITVME